MNPRAAITGFIVGVTLAASTVAVAAQGWQWFAPEAHGSASGKLGALSALSVDLQGFDAVFPGDDIVVRGAVSNPNGRPLSILSASVEDVTTDPGCGQGKWTDSTDGAVVKPGDNTLTLGTWHVADNLPGRCQGSSLKLNLVVRSAYGVAP